ncbi:MAG: oligogalacturonate lyase family protein, partial [Steroidobacteraceae bacterium]
MTTLPLRAPLLATLLVSTVPTAFAASEPPVEWIDGQTHHRVIRLSTEPGTRSLYFHQNSVTPDGRFVMV